MRRSLKFRPAGLLPLEDRVVMSTAVAPTAVVGNIQPGPAGQSPSPQATVEGNAGNFHGQSIAQTLAAGNPVFVQVTTRFPANVFNPNATTEINNKLIVPDKAAHTVTTTENIVLRNDAGFEQVVDVATTSGNTTTHNITTSITHPTHTDPNNVNVIIPTTTLTQHETLIQLVQGGKTYLKGAIILPGGSPETFTGTTTNSGSTSTTVETLTDSQGFDTKTNSVVTVHNELYSSTVTTTVNPDGSTSTSKSNSWILRMEPPLPQQ